MPSKARYAREKAAAARQGTTPYRRRIQSVARRQGAVYRKGEARQPWCVVCGARIEESRPRSVTDRQCGNEEMRRYRAGDGDWHQLRGVNGLAADEVWVARARANARAEGRGLRDPVAVRLGVSLATARGHGRKLSAG